MPKPKPKSSSLDARRVSALDSEDEAGTYAPARSSDDTGESDAGVLGKEQDLDGDEGSGGSYGRPRESKDDEEESL